MSNQQQSGPRKESTLDLGDLTILEEPAIQQEPPRETPLTDLIMSQCNLPRQEEEPQKPEAGRKWILLGFAAGLLILGLLWMAFRLF